MAHHHRRHRLGVLAMLLFRSPPTAVIVGHSIRYDSTAIASRALGVLTVIGCLVPTIAPFFALTLPMPRLIGVTLVLSLGLTVLIEHDAVTSVWCFFAAILSVQTVLALGKDRRTSTEHGPAFGPTTWLTRSAEFSLTLLSADSKPTTIAASRFSSAGVGASDVAIVSREVAGRPNHHRFSGRDSGQRF